MQETITLTEVNTSRTIAEVLQRGLKDTGRLLGDKNAYISMESDWDKAVNEGQLGVVKRDLTSSTSSAFRLSMTFEDKSTVYFTLRTKDLALASLYAPHLVQEVVDTLQLQRVVWQIAGTGSVHFASYKQGGIRHPKSLISKFSAFKKKASEQIAKFLYVDEEEY